MLKIATWGRNKPIFPAIIAQIIAIFSRTLYGYLTKVREFKNIRGVEIPKSNLWLSFYYKSNHIDNKLTEIFTNNLVDNKIIKHIIDLSSDLQAMSINEKSINHEKIKSESSNKSKILTIEQKLKAQFDDDCFFKLVSNLSSEAIPFLSAIYNFHIKLIEDDISEKKHPDTIETNDEELFIPEILFFLKVIFPCWIFYQEDHTILFKKARQGDIDSLIKLLTLDKTVVGDRFISEQIAHSISNDPIKFDLLTKAIKSKPKELNTLPKIKIFLAGLISVVSEEFGHKFSAPQIRELFDAVAVDYGYDELIDPDLPDSPEAFQKAIQRERPFWQNSL